jgi:phosphate transport system substrate-binding protein
MPYRTALAVLAMAIGAMFAATPGAAQQRQGVLITGSSTVAPFTQAVAAALRDRGGPATEIRIVGTVGGFAEFCQGVGPRFPDIATASRPINRQEFVFCNSRGVNEILELPIGYDGIVLAHRAEAESPDFRLEHLWRGLAREVPFEGRIAPNSYRFWNEVSPTLPPWPIRVIGPPATSGTRDSFHDLALLPGCLAAAEMRALPDAAQRRRLCLSLREDGRWVESGEDDDAIVQAVADGPPGTLGLFGYGFLDRNRDRLRPIRIEGREASRTTIAAGSYPLSRPLFLYVKRAHLGRMAGIEEFLTEYLSDLAIGPGGYLVRRGLVPLDPVQLAATRRIWHERQPLRLPALN